ncbi:MAG: hypothetical protein AC479_07825 [miscellaneous Crenarchaeota group-6 archaeon AD8-1]|nr:MAG: hypothetical protein AC479_07825 [miscellaneous Crenarchaeota group-6 archaeon AD8-1]
MTRPNTEETLLKCNPALTETKTFENITNPLDNNSLTLYDLPSRHELVKYTNPNKLNSDFEEKEAKIKLYNLEKDEIQIKPIKIDLGIDLYQMEEK